MKVWASRIIAVLFTVVFFLLMASGLDYVLVDDTREFTRLMMHEFYNQEDIDILCVGPSHFYRGLNPEIINDQTGKKVFVASSGNQQPDTSLALIKEAIKLYDIEHIYLEISASVAQETGNYKDRDSLVSTYLISDYLKPSLNKTQLLLEASTSDHFINSFWRARRHWEYIFDSNYIKNIIQIKNTDNYKKYGNENTKTDNSWYVGKGYVATTTSIDDHLYYSKLDVDHIDTSIISDDWKKSIELIIEYCNKYDVDITLVNVPIPNFKLAVYENYDEYIDFIKEFIKDKNCDYVDFNLIKEHVFKYKQNNYEDVDHLNIDGAKEFSNVFSKYLLNKECDDIFYSNIEEKLNNADPDYYGIAYRDIEEQNKRIIKMVSNIPNYYEFKVDVIKNDGSTETLQDFDINDELSIPLNYFIENNENTGKIIVSFRRYGINEEAMRLTYY